MCCACIRCVAHLCTMCIRLQVAASIVPPACVSCNVGCAWQRHNRCCSQGALKWPALAHTLLDVSRGLKYLHDLDIIHGDIKAANVMLKSVHRSVSPVRFTAKLADLGLAQLRSHAVRTWRCSHESLHTLQCLLLVLLRLCRVLFT